LSHSSAGNIGGSSSSSSSSKGIQSPQHNPSDVCVSRGVSGKHETLVGSYAPPSATLMTRPPVGRATCYFERRRRRILFVSPSKRGPATAEWLIAGTGVSDPPLWQKELPT